MPTPVKVARVLMLVVSGIGGALIVVLPLIEDVTPELLGAAAWLAASVAANLWLALSMPKAGIGLRRAILGLQALYILLALGAIGQGDPSGITSLILPVTIVILVTRPSATAFFRTPKATSGRRRWRRRSATPTWRI